jgi:hypothetical protein
MVREKGEGEGLVCLCDKRSLPVRRKAARRPKGKMGRGGKGNQEKRKRGWRIIGCSYRTSDLQTDSKQLVHLLKQ